jgi:outer membrane lipoprotein-sorting protein
MKRTRPALCNPVPLLAVALIVATAPALAAEPSAWTLDSALKQIDKSNQDFKTAVVDVQLSAIDGPDAEPRAGSGKGYFSRDGSFRIDLAKPEAKTLLSSGDDLYVYEPARAVVERYAIGKHPERLEPYLSLGFSVTGKAMSKDYLVGLLGEEIVNDQRTIHLELTPKSEEVRSKVSRIQIWIEQGSWLPIRLTVFHSDAAQSVSASYSHASRNVPVDDAVFKPKWPKGTETIKR